MGGSSSTISIVVQLKKPGPPMWQAESPLPHRQAKRIPTLPEIASARNHVILSHSIRVITDSFDQWTHSLLSLRPLFGSKLSHLKGLPGCTSRAYPGPPKEPSILLSPLHGSPAGGTSGRRHPGHRRLRQRRSAGRWRGARAGAAQLAGTRCGFHVSLLGLEAKKRSSDRK